MRSDFADIIHTRVNIEFQGHDTQRSHKDVEVVKDKVVLFTISKLCPSPFFILVRLHSFWCILIRPRQVFSTTMSNDH